MTLPNIGSPTVRLEKAAAKRYLIYTSAKKNGTYKKVKVVNKAKTTKVSFKAKTGKKLYVKVAAYCKVSGKKVAGTKSSSKKVTVK